MSVFKFKYFTVQQSDSAMKVGTDAMLLGAFVQAEGKAQALDIGTGTGVLSLMLAQKNETIQITGIDIDEASVQEANLNFMNSMWSKRLFAFQNDFLGHDFNRRFDLIISNPPYFSTTNENKEVRKAQARHVSSLEIKPFIEKVGSLLTPTGCFWLIIPYNDFTRWYLNCEKNGLRIARKIDVAGKDGNEPIRCILKIDQTTVITKNETFCIRNSDNSYSDEYIELTKEFHGTEL